MTEPEILGPVPGSLEARASLALKILAAIDVAAVVISLFPPPDPMSWLQAVTFNTSTGFLAAVYVVVAVALDRRRPWAYAAARPLLVAVGVAGLVVLGLVVADGRLRVPFDVVLAAWAWLGPADHRAAPRRDHRSVGLVGTALVLLAIPLTGSTIFGWGGILDVHPPDLRATLEVDCGASGAAADASGGPPSEIAVRYEWSWATGSPFPSGDDVVVIGWTGDDGLGRPLYLLGTTPATATGIVQGRQVEPSAAIARAVEAEAEGSWHWGIQLGAQQLRPGRIEVSLARTREAPPEPGPLRITATYIHLGLWRADVAAVTCSWDG
ncbi:MAG: hypothetical protein AB1736_00310 [Chloroflexota bacterium]